MSQGQRAPGKNGSSGSNHPCRPAHRLGIINYLHTKGKQWTSLMSRSMWPQQSNPLQSPQDAYCRTSCTWICKFVSLHQAQCTSWILAHSPWWRIKPLNYLQQPLWEVPFPASSLWSGLLTGHLPEEDGPVPQRVPECTGIANDITIHGCTEAEHDVHLQNPMQLACKYGVVFNPQKTHVKAPAINFFGFLYNANDVHPDLEKVDAVHVLPAPTNVTKLQEFLSMVTYLSPFICGLSTLTAPLWELQRKDANFTWNSSYEATFQQLKQAVVSDTTLRYFNPSLPVTIQINASQVGLGTALLQNNKPIAFGSKALTDAECRYANIEREMLAVVFGADRFCTYIYGQSFMIKSDHKLLQSISRKNLADMPAWLQHMMLHLQGYDLKIHYHPDKEMVIKDTLSWFSPWPGPDFPLDITIHNAFITQTHRKLSSKVFISDPEMWALTDLIVTGWPKDIKEVPHPLHPYWQHRETLSIKDGLVLWGEALVIPPAKRERVLHQFHQGIMKPQLLTSGSFSWPSINKAIEEVVCSVKPAHGSRVRTLQCLSHQHPHHHAHGRCVPQISSHSKELTTW